MPNRKAVCTNFKKVLLEDYEKNNDILRCLKAYIGFMMEHASITPKDKSSRMFTDWQIKDMCMSTHNNKIDINRTILETLWRWSRRIGKSQKLSALAVFAALMNLKVVWRATFADQLGQVSEWFNMNPFVRENKITSLNKIGVFGSPDINIAVLSEAKVASRGTDWLFYDEGGWCFKNHKKYEYYEASRAMIMDSADARITHASTPAKLTSFHDASMFLEKEEFKLKTKLQSHHPWYDSTWITQEKIDRERELHSDCPWYIEQNYLALWVIYGGAVFTNVIEEGDPNAYPTFELGFLENLYNNGLGVENWGVDFNGEDTQHYRIGIRYDDNYVYVLKEIKFLDLWELEHLSGSIEVEDGLFNNQFSNQLRRMGIPVIYKAWNEHEKQERVQELQKRKIVINKRTCPQTWKNLLEAGLDKNSRLPKLEKRTDQHGLDGLLHSMHNTKGKIYIPSRFKQYNRSPLLGGVKMYNPMQHM